MIDWSKAPEGATHAAFLPDTQQHIFFKFADDWWFDVKNKEWSYVGGKPNFDLIERPKTITQAVFDGLPPEYRWAAVDNRGSAYAFTAKPKPFKSDFRDWDFNNVVTISLGGDYNTTNWQNSLIERQDVSNRVEQLRSVEAARQVEKDAVNNPSHYTTGGIECIDAMQAMLSREEFIGYLRGNIFKYQWRYQHKNGIEDLKKAQWYQDKLIEVESND